MSHDTNDERLRKREHECECRSFEYYDTDDVDDEIGRLHEQNKKLRGALVKSVEQNDGIARHRKWLAERAEWLKKERMNGGNWEYLLRKEEETRYCLEKFEAHLAALVVTKEKNNE